MLRERRARIRLENLRCEKWRQMLDEWPVWWGGSERGKGAEARRAKVKERCRKGIPEAMRSKAWFGLVNGAAKKARYPTFYRELLALPIVTGITPVAEEAPGAADDDDDHGHDAAAVPPQPAAATVAVDAPPADGDATAAASAGGDGDAAVGVAASFSVDNGASAAAASGFSAPMSLGRADSMDYAGIAAAAAAAIEGMAAEEEEAAAAAAGRSRSAGSTGSGRSASAHAAARASVYAGAPSKHSVDLRGYADEPGAPSTQALTPAEAYATGDDDDEDGYAYADGIGGAAAGGAGTGHGDGADVDDAALVQRMQDILGPSGLEAVGGATPEIIDTIERDINRTFPHYSMFSEVGGIGQTALFRILVAYAQSDRTVGYCQGMGFLAALFLSYMPEEDAFFMFRALMQDAPHKLCDLYAPGLPKVGLLEHTLQGLLNRTMPKLAAHMHSLGLHPTMYAAQWFLTIFTYNFPFAVVVRIWDTFLCEGWKVVFRYALAALKLAEADLLASPSFESIMTTFRELPGKLDADVMTETAFAFSLSIKDIEALQAEYNEVVEKGFLPCSPQAGHGIGAHVKAREAEERARAARRAGKRAAP